MFIRENRLNFLNGIPLKLCCLLNFLILPGITFREIYATHSIITTCNEYHLWCHCLHSDLPVIIIIFVCTVKRYDGEYLGASSLIPNTYEKFLHQKEEKVSFLFCNLIINFSRFFIISITVWGKCGSSSSNRFFRLS